MACALRHRSASNPRRKPNRKRLQSRSIRWRMGSDMSIDKKRWCVAVPRLWGWCRVDCCEFWSRYEAENWLANFGPRDGRVLEMRTCQTDASMGECLT